MLQFSQIQERLYAAAILEVERRQVKETICLASLWLLLALIRN